MHEKYTFATFLQRGPAYREWQGRLVRGQGCLASHVVRVVVADQGASSGPRLIDDPMAESGRGLLVVRGLSALTGVAGGRAGPPGVGRDHLERGRSAAIKLPGRLRGRHQRRTEVAGPATCRGADVVRLRHVAVVGCGRPPRGGPARGRRSPQELSRLLDALQRAPDTPHQRSAAAVTDPVAARAGRRDSRSADRRGHRHRAPRAAAVPALHSRRRAGIPGMLTRLPRAVPSRPQADPPVIAGQRGHGLARSQPLCIRVCAPAAAVPDSGRPRRLSRQWRGRLQRTPLRPAFRSCAHDR